jgi:hypothetical protein
MRIARSSCLVALAVLGLGSGCTSDAPAKGPGGTGGSTPGVGGSTPGTGGSTPGTGTGGTTGAGGSGSGPSSGVVQLPMTVTTEYTNQGWFGDPAVQAAFMPGSTVIKQSDSSTGPCANRDPMARGKCLQVVYTPPSSLPSGPGFVGVFFLTTVMATGEANWGTEPAKNIAPGAKQISFFAASASDGLSVTFKAGTDKDSFVVPESAQTLTTGWKKYNAVARQHDLRQQRHRRVRLGAARHAQGGDVLPRRHRLGVSLRLLLLFTVLLGCVAPADPPVEPVPVPFAVSDYYSPDGFWGDGETFGFMDVQRVCPDRPADAQGDCYTVTYRPGPKRYGGIFWQYPHNNWGFERGRQIGAAPRASRSPSRARRAVRSWGSAPASRQARHADGFSLSTQKATLGTAWAPQEMLLRGEPYNGKDGLLGAFEVVFEAPPGDGATVFYLTDIRWQ